MIQAHPVGAAAPTGAWKPTVFAILLEELNNTLGDDMARLDTMEVVNAFSVAFQTLRETAAERRARASTDWLEERTARLGALGKRSDKGKPDTER